MVQLQDEKCVIIVDEALPIGMIANTAAIIGITLGKRFPACVGCDVTDKSGYSHLGIIQFPVPILKAGKEKLKAMRETLYLPDYAELTCVDFSDVAQSCNDYDAFIDKAAGTYQNDYTYFGIGIYGGKKLVNKLTGNLPLLR